MTAPREKGFTLLEVVVVIGIIATLAGIMIPFIYRVWEGNERELTRERMTDLKKAMVGDPRLVQGGVRTHFGFAGDIGQLPAALSGLLGDPGVANWNGPYLAPGFDPSLYAQDAWGNAFSYQPVKDGSNRYTSATLRSAGPDGTFGTADDINDTTDPSLQISPSEVAPGTMLRGNLDLDFQTPPLAPKNFFVGVAVVYLDGAGQYALTTCCDSAAKQVDGTAGNTRINYTRSYSCNLPVALPVGAISMEPRIYGASSCGAGSVLTGTGMTITGLVDRSVIYANLQIQSVLIP